MGLGAAASGPRPGRRLVRFRDLRWADVNRELQVHTTWTDGQADLATLLAHAWRRGLRTVAFTEHVRRETTWFPAFAGAVRSWRPRYPELEILVGCEAKALDARGSLDATERILAECDLVLGSVHRLPDGAGGFVHPSALPAAACLERELAVALGLLDAAPIDVLAHPCGMSLRRSPDVFPEAALRALCRRGLERGVAIEINPTYLGPHWGAFLRLCAELDPYVSIGSDAHRPEHLAACRDKLVADGIGRP
jgi:putative hydrolase